MRNVHLKKHSTPRRSIPDAPNPLNTYSCMLHNACCIILTLYYRNCISITTQNVQSLLSASCFLDFSEVFTKCADFLKWQIDPTNCIGEYHFSLRCTVYFTVLYCTLLYFTVLYCTLLYFTVLYCTLLYFTVLYCTLLYFTVLYFTVLYCTLLYFTVLYCTLLYFTVLYCTLLYFTVLYCTLLYFIIHCTLLYTVLNYFHNYIHLLSK